ncbi:MAG: hypothetical protein LH619_08865 [Chitinophagaceae bacterium]|nr:hypothetical protein [Chitinophagaceae bacterium]
MNRSSYYGCLFLYRNLGQLCHFFRADMGLGMAIEQKLGVNVENGMPKQLTKETVLP